MNCITSESCSPINAPWTLEASDEEKCNTLKSLTEQFCLNVLLLYEFTFKSSTKKLMVCLLWAQPKVIKVITEK